MGKNSEHYVNNVEFCDALVIHRNKVFEWKDSINYLNNLYDTQRLNTHTLLELHYLKSYYEYLIASLLNKPIVSNYLVIQVNKIATRFAQRPLYINRTYKEDMINNAVENCLKYITNFDPTITTNAFSYFTQYCYYAFLRTILSENRQRDIESKITEECEFSAFFASSEGLEYHEKQQLKESLELRCRNEKLSEYRN